MVGQPARRAAKQRVWVRSTQRGARDGIEDEDDDEDAERTYARQPPTLGMHGAGCGRRTKFGHHRKTPLMAGGGYLGSWIPHRLASPVRFGLTLPGKAAAPGAPDRRIGDRRMEDGEDIRWSPIRLSPIRLSVSGSHPPTVSGAGWPPEVAVVQSGARSGAGVWLWPDPESCRAPRRAGGITSGLLRSGIGGQSRLQPPRAADSLGFSQRPARMDPVGNRVKTEQSSADV